jgi:hypothetical protein
MILTIIPSKEQDLQLAGIAAAALCGAGLTQPFPGGMQKCVRDACRAVSADVRLTAR